MSDRYRKATNVYLHPALRKALEERARAEKRTLSKMTEILLEHALGIEEEPPANGPPGAKLNLARMAKR